ncbi:MAG: hypothetical protein SFW36_05165 [Leptolyngbyaceae cyanobacterium bins.59]|nr:hypothetical protein [Leptolyngbyaceae cyanobacterium bins.59]
MDKRPSLSKGFPIALQWALFFLLIFYFLGYSAIMSIGLAILGGSAIRLVVDWWLSKDEVIATPDPSVEPEPPPQPKMTVAARRRAAGEIRWQRTKTRKRRFTWPFKRGRRS